MTKKIGSSPAGADIWVDKPRAFIFLILRMITRTGIGKNFIDLMSFLRTTDSEIKDFLKTMVPSVEWLLELVKSREGRKILKAFNLPKSKEKLLLIGKEMEGGNAEPSICDLLIEDLPEHTFLGDLVTGKDLLTHLWQKDADELVDIRGDYMANGRGQGRNLPIDHGEQFLAGLYRIVGLCNMHGLNRVFGAERIAQFRKDKVVPYKWVEILMGYDGGKAHLERFEGILKISYRGKKKEEMLEQQDEIVTLIEDFSMKDGSGFACNSDHDSPIISLGEEKSDLIVVDQADESVEKILELKPKPIIESGVSPQEINEAEATSQPPECEGEIVEPKSESLVQEGISPLETVKLIESAFIKKEGVLESQSASVVENHSGKIAESTIIHLAKGEGGKAKKIRVKKKTVEQGNPDYNGYRLVPIGEVFLVLKYVQEAFAEKRITDVDIAGALKLEPTDIIKIRKGGNRLHSGHLNVLMKEFNLEPSLLERWM